MPVQFRYFYDLVGEESVRGMAPEEMVGWHNNPLNPPIMRHWMQQCVPVDQAHTQVINMLIAWAGGWWWTYEVERRF